MRRVPELHVGSRQRRRMRREVERRRKRQAWRFALEMLRQSHPSRRGYMKRAAYKIMLANIAAERDTATRETEHLLRRLFRRRHSVAG